MRYYVEQRQNKELIEESEKEHWVREGSRQSILSQTEPILEDQHDASYSERNADCYDTNSEVSLDIVIEVKITRR